MGGQRREQGALSLVATPWAQPGMLAEGMKGQMLEPTKGGWLGHSQHRGPGPWRRDGRGRAPGGRSCQRARGPGLVFSCPTGRACVPYSGPEDGALAVMSGKPSISLCAQGTPVFVPVVYSCLFLNFLGPNPCDPLRKLQWGCLCSGEHSLQTCSLLDRLGVSRVRMSRARRKPALSSPCWGSLDSVVQCPGMNPRKGRASVK